MHFIEIQGYRINMDNINAISPVKLIGEPASYARPDSQHEAYVFYIYFAGNTPGGLGDGTLLNYYKSNEEAQKDLDRLWHFIKTGED